MSKPYLCLVLWGDYEWQGVQAQNGREAAEIAVTNLIPLSDSLPASQMRVRVVGPQAHDVNVIEHTVAAKLTWVAKVAT